MRGEGVILKNWGVGETGSWQEDEWPQGHGEGQPGSAESIEQPSNRYSSSQSPGTGSGSRSRTTLEHAAQDEQGVLLILLSSPPFR